MDTPPEVPASPPPAPRRGMGRAITITLLVPIVLLAAGMAVAGGLQIKDAEGYFGLVFAVACLCSVAGAVMICLSVDSIIGRFSLFLLSGGLLMALYTTCIFAGCSAVSGPMNFH